MKNLSKLLITVSASAMILSPLATPARAADLLIPSTAASLLPLRPAASLLPAAAGSIRETVERAPAADAKWKKQWTISLAPLFVSESLDAASSYGMRELNPLLASANGGFGMKATTVKFGVVGALTAAEYLIVRKYPRSAKFFTIVNWTTAGATTGLAVHNYRLH